MPETVIVSNRGQITLPSAIRKQLAIRPGDVVTVEERGGEIVLKPAIVLEIEHYSDEQIKRWDQEDQLSDAERSRILARLQNR